MLYIPILIPLSACSHHSNHSFHLGSRGSENESVSGNPNTFNTIPQWWAHLRSREADSSARSALRAGTRTGLSYSYPTLKSSCTRYLTFWYTYTCPTRYPNSMSMSMLSRWCRAFPALTDTRLSLTVPIQVFSKKKGLWVVPQKRELIYSCSLAPLSLAEAALCIKQCTLWNWSTPRMPSSSHTAGTATQTQTQNHSSCRSCALKSNPPQWASHPQKSLPDMLLSLFQAISTPSGHRRGETSASFSLLIISPLFYALVSISIAAVTSHPACSMKSLKWWLT